MLAVKHQQNIKSIFVILVLALVLIAEPVLAKKDRGRQRKSGKENSNSKQVQKAPTQRQAPRAPKTSKKSSKAASSTRPRNKPTRPAVSKSSNSRASNKSVRSRASRPKTVQSKAQPKRTTPSVRSKTKTSAAAPKRSVSSATKTRSATTSNSSSKRFATPARKRQSPKRNVTRTVTVKKPSIATSSKTIVSVKPRTSSAKSTKSKNTSIVRKFKSVNKKVSVISRKNTAAVTKANKRQPKKTGQVSTGSSKPKIRSVKRTNKDNNYITRKSRTVTRTPEITTTRSRTTRIIGSDGPKTTSKNRVRIAGGTESSLTRKIRRNRTRTILTSSRLSQPAREESHQTSTSIRQRRSVRRDHLPQIRERLRNRRGTRRHTQHNYRERRQVVNNFYDHEHIYRDYHGTLHRRSILPRFRFSVRYNYGSWFSFRYVYPYYHRKYIFVSLGGYWPSHYRHLRYYWYGYHPYYWYGYYPVAREIEGDTYNYYTYNYYDSSIGSSVDNTAFQDASDRPFTEPGAETLADVYFDQGVKAFEEGNYQRAIEKFTLAMELAPDDRILPFAYSQALFANGQYSEAAKALRYALTYITPEEEGIFYPRGLYSDEDVLIEQIEHLIERTQLQPFKADLQLLLGYQLFGVGELDAAIEPLVQARFDSDNRRSAAVLLGLLEKIKIEEQNQNDIE